jgi:hypothetical protein
VRLLFYDYGAGAVYAKNAFSRGGVQICRKFVGELRHLRSDRERMASLLRGYIDFSLKRLQILK